MIRSTVAVIVGLFVWAICATGLDLLLRQVLSGYGAAEPQMQFTTGMMIARLAFPGGIPSVAAGFATSWIARGNGRVVLVLGIILLAAFIPAHYQLWAKFPLWYHLTFLGSLIFLPWFGARLQGLLGKT
jgi:hypothetical protein